MPNYNFRGINRALERNYFLRAVAGSEMDSLVGVRPSVSEGMKTVSLNSPDDMPAVEVSREVLPTALEMASLSYEHGIDAARRRAYEEPAEPDSIDEWIGNTDSEYSIGPGFFSRSLTARKVDEGIELELTSPSGTVASTVKPTFHQAYRTLNNADLSRHEIAVESGTYEEDVILEGKEFYDPLDESRWFPPGSDPPEPDDERDPRKG